MRKLILTFLVMGLSIARAQDSLVVEVIKEDISRGFKPGYMIVIPKSNVKDLAANWKKQLKTDSKKEVIDKKTEFVLPMSLLPAISSDSVAVFSRISASKTEKNSTELKVFVMASDSTFISAKEAPSVDDRIKNYVRLFGVSQYRNAVVNELNFEQKKNNEMKEELRRMEHENENTKKKIASNNYDNEKLQEKIEQDNRLTVVRESLIQKWMQVTKYTAGNYNAKDLATYTDSSLKKGKALPLYKNINPNTVLFSFAKEKITAEKWVKYNKDLREMGPYEQYNYETLMKQFVKSSCDKYYRAHIEEYYQPIGGQLKEFNEANLLFSVMDKHVWSKAAEDSVGLKNYYNQHKEQYKWQPACLRSPPCRECGEPLRLRRWRTIRVLNRG